MGQFFAYFAKVHLFHSFSFSSSLTTPSLNPLEKIDIREVPSPSVRPCTRSLPFDIFCLSFTFRLTMEHPCRFGVLQLVSSSFRDTTAVWGDHTMKSSYAMHRKGVRHGETVRHRYAETGLASFATCSSPEIQCVVRGFPRNQNHLYQNLVMQLIPCLAHPVKAKKCSKQEETADRPSEDGPDACHVTKDRTNQASNLKRDLRNVFSTRRYNHGAFLRPMFLQCCV